jgi:hypothetical protein
MGRWSESPQGLEDRSGSLASLAGIAGHRSGVYELVYITKELIIHSFSYKRKGRSASSASCARA